MSRHRIPRILWALLGSLALVPGARAEDFVVRPAAPAFRDVGPDHWAYDAVEWLRKEGLLEGWGKRFHGRRSFTRFEMAEILARYTQRLLEAQAELAGIGPDGNATPLVEEVSRLREAVERVAKAVATHRALLENPRSQGRWRRRVQDLKKQKAARERAEKLRRSRRSARPTEDPRKKRLLAALERLHASSAASPDLGDEEGGEFIPFESAETPTRLLAAREPAPPPEALPPARPTPPPPPARSPARVEQMHERLRGLLALSRVMRGPDPAPALPGRAPAAPPREDVLGERIQAALEDVRQGNLDPERARVIGYLASLALEAQKLHTGNR